MKTLLFTSTLFILFSCSPPTKQEAVDYYVTIRYEESLDILIRLDDQYALVTEYLFDPDMNLLGPSAEEFELLMAEQNELVPEIRKCIHVLEKMESLGDDAKLLENLILFLYHRVQFEEEVMMRLVRSIENGMSTEELDFLQTRRTQLFDLGKQQNKFLDAETQFLKEFLITEADIDKELDKRES